MVALWRFGGVPYLSVGTITLSALVVDHVLVLVRHRARDFDVLLQPVLCLKFLFWRFHRR